MSLRPSTEMSLFFFESVDSHWIRWFGREGRVIYTGSMAPWSHYWMGHFDLLVSYRFILPNKEWVCVYSPWYLHRHQRRNTKVLKQRLDKLSIRNRRLRLPVHMGQDSLGEGVYLRYGLVVIAGDSWRKKRKTALGFVGRVDRHVGALWWEPMYLG